MSTPAPTDPPRDAEPRRLDPAALERAQTRLLRAGTVPWLHEEAARRMAERLPLVRLQPAQVQDWSGPLGGSVALLQAAYPKATLTLVDDASPAAAQAPSTADEPASTAQRRWGWPWARRRVDLPRTSASAVAPASADLVWANMRLQAVESVAECFVRWSRALSVGGFLMFSCFGPGSLPELRQIYRRRAWGDAFAMHVDMHDLGDALVHAGLADPVMDQEIVTLTWPDVDAMLGELRGMGANLSPARHAGLRTPRWGSELRQELLMLAREGRPALSFELVYGHAFKAAPRARVQATTEIQLEDMRSMVRKSRA